MAVILIPFKRTHDPHLQSVWSVCGRVFALIRSIVRLKASPVGFSVLCWHGDVLNPVAARGGVGGYGLRHCTLSPASYFTDGRAR